jgi:hypothetical protein
LHGVMMYVVGSFLLHIWQVVLKNRTYIYIFTLFLIVLPSCIKVSSAGLYWQLSLAHLYWPCLPSATILCLDSFIESIVTQSYSSLQVIIS